MEVGDDFTRTPTAMAATEEEAQTCLYCANLKVLRDLLPPKRCDYVRPSPSWRCQFCTLKFPLLGVRKGMPKAMKGNSRICIQCFGQIWQENELTADTSRRSRGDANSSKHLSLPEIQEGGRESRAVIFGTRSTMMDSGRRSSTMADSGRRGSMMDSGRSSMLESGRRESMMVDRVWAGKESFGASQRLSFMESSNENDVTKRPVASTSPHGLSYRMASFLGLVAYDDPSGISMISAIDLWMSLFAASILLVIALADGFSLQQRVCYCVATYGLFLTLHPWIHADRATGEPPKQLEEKKEQPTSSNATLSQTVSPVKPKRRKSAAAAGSGPVPAAYKAKIDDMEKTMAYYLSDECPWKMVKTTTGGEVYEMTANKTPFPLLKIEVFVTGISMAKFMAFIDSKDPRDRSVWDLNVANFEVIETFDNSDADDDADVSVCVNSQKPFLGGLIAPRDFCLLYVSREDSVCFCSVEHPKVPVRPGSTRGNVFLSCFHCKEDTSAEGPAGFALTYICQADIGGSVPTRLLYNGTMDNMEKMTKVFQQAGRVFPR
ncbi:hypothetical protein BBJ28_00011568 [Nothophytophthora sp. Chile5]|nr:hypothetical protein BBJ28_00011568 [Nothophytophthora sp. Chile5]